MSLDAASVEAGSPDGGSVELGPSLGDDADLATSTLSTMWRIRRFEEAVDDLFARGLMHGTMHLSIGQEASATGTCAALRPTDFITSTHRGHGHCIAKGADLTRMMAELLAKETGYCRGRGGSMHIADVATGNLGANGIVAGGIPIAAGAALAARMRGTDEVVACFFGDGAVNEGAFHEAANLAAIWQLPLILVCENNKYGMSFSTEKAFAIEHLAQRAAGYGFEGVTVDGNDVEAVHHAVGAAVAKARAGQGPTFVEAVTYRWKGHSKSDKNLYRTRDEISEWQAKDPIARFEQAVIERAVLTQERVEEIRAAAVDAVRASVVDARNAPDADPADMLAAVYAPA